MDPVRNDLEEKLLQLIANLNANYNLSNCHMVSFITHDVFNELLPEDSRKFLLSLTEDQLCALPSGQLFEISNPILPEGSGASEQLLEDSNDIMAEGSGASHVQKFVENAQKFTVESLLAGSPELLQNLDDHCSLPTLNFKHCMGDKKGHEVERLAALIANFANQQKIHDVVDVGSGRGYLGSMLALCYSMNVLGLDNLDILTARFLLR